ncbi:DUF4258 domain-containing protein [Synechococcus sp. BDU 130192]|uniref:DUF4258 domain-containing protein n=1 Tax=Synechococcus sp. BDU 130192 TaxID=2042059 RepID=UPI000C089275
MEFILSHHALEESKKRGISLELVESVLDNPQQIFKQNETITVYQSQVIFDNGKKYLIRIFMNTTVDPKKIVTLYRTSQIKRYWRAE